LPSDAELEAEAARAREQSRREAERILTQEAEERKVVEDRLRGLLDSTRRSPAIGPLSTSPAPVSPLQMGTPPASSPREGGNWWAMAKSKLTPSKDPLTPAQQLVHDTRSKDKKDKKNKLPDPSYLNLNSARPYTPSPNQSPVFPNRHNTVAGSPYAAPVNLTDDNSLYIQKTPEGALDVNSTLIGLAKRFEKLEKWSVSHVRALEERMSDVERWLVEKEEEREREKELSGETPSRQTNPSITQPREPGITLLAEQVTDMKHDLNELRTRVGVLGREVAKVAVGSPQATPVRVLPSAVMASDHSQSSSAESPRARSVERGQAVSEDKERVAPRQSAEPSATSSVTGEKINAAPTTNMETPSAAPVPPVAERVSQPKARALPARPAQPAPTEVEEENPGESPSTVSTTTARTKLPYPSGDYTSLPTSPASPPLSPRNSIRSQHQHISGLPRSGSPFDGRESPTPAPSGLPMAPPTRPLASRTGSSSPTPPPRKRYTVALGKPITSPPASETGSTNSFGTQLERAFSKDAPDLGLGVLAPGPAVAEGRGSIDKGKKKVASVNLESGKSAPSNPPVRRPRPQSTYGGASAASLGPTAPLRPRVRSKSTDKIGLGANETDTRKDPYLDRQRNRERDSTRTPVTTGRQKLPVDQLVKFFDGGN
jgi:hypothetical protein